jgi:hypothetical protein
VTLNRGWFALGAALLLTAIGGAAVATNRK